MKKIIKPRASGKTTELIKMAEATNSYIVTFDRQRADYIFRFAEELGYKILYPVAFADALHSKFRGSFVRNILIDDADAILAGLFPGMTVDAITMTEEL